MQFSTKIHDKYVLFTPEGEKLNSVVAPELKTQMVILNEQGKNNIILDMSNVKYADSSGLSGMLRTHKMCKQAGGILVLTNLQDHVQKLITISMLQSTLNILPTNQEAREAIFMHEIQKEVEGDDEEVAEGDE